MADPAQRNEKDRGGGWFVDATCIDCDVARQLAPGLIEEDASGLSYFVREPRTKDEIRAAWRALLACPSGSIGAPRGLKPERDVFPMQVTGSVHLLGYHAEDSFGAHSYVALAPEGNFMVDAPRFVPPLVDWLREHGGVTDILLTHRDDVADAQRYAEALGARVWIHREDADAAPFASDVFHEETPVRPGLRAIPFPGHTRGSALYLWQDRFLFTGDSLAWSRRRNDLTAFRDATWHSWSVLTESMRSLTTGSFEWVLPGHGSWGNDTANGMRRRVQGLIERMRARSGAPTW